MTENMVHVRMLFDKRGGGRYDGREWPDYGGVILVPQWEADEMIACGDAELATEPEKKLSWDVLKEPRLDWKDPDDGDIQDVAHLRHEDAAEQGDIDDDFDRDDPDEDDDFDREPTVKESAPERPAVGAAKAAWIKWAVQNGSSIEDANGMTKADLIARYGK